MAPRRHARQGVVLLLILSLLVLFSLLAMTFLIGATRYRQGAESFSRHDLVGDDAAKLADVAVYQMLREPKSPFSSVWGHSLLSDLYGMTGMVLGKADIAAVSTAGDLMQVRVNNSVSDINTGTLSPLDDYYAGCVFSVWDGVGPWLTSRVVRYDAPNSVGAAADFYVERFERDLAGSDRFFLVNGKPFNGPGVGYDPTSGMTAHGEWLDADDPAQDGDGADGDDFLVPYALLPNYSRFAATGAVVLGGDHNESYDALDYQNMFLAKNPATGVRYGSFHRPELIRYWQQFWREIGAYNSNTGFNRWTAPGHYARTRNLVVFRPMPWDHPHFTGSNPTLTALPISGPTGWWSQGADSRWGFAGVDDDNNGVVDDVSEVGATGSDDHISQIDPDPMDPNVKSLDDRLMAALMDAGVQDIDGFSGIEGAYDVDNDGDGRLDSFWLDLQLPVKVDKNGRRYKPLVAFLIVDQDGRLNVNAHGNLAQIQTEYHRGDATASEGRRPYAGHATGAIWNYEDINEDGVPDTNQRLARGMGYGPAEISFRHLVDDSGDRTDNNTYEKFLIARYGADEMPGGNATAEEALSIFKSVGRPSEYGSTNSGKGSWNYPSAYLNPPDMFGRGTVALDYAGRPVWRYAGESSTFTRVGGGSLGSAHERINHPYELNLVQPDGGDTPFTPADLEGLLRWRDSDAGLLSRRLLDPDQDGVLDLPSNLDALSKLLTTHSSYVPSQPTALVPRKTGASNELYDILFPPGPDAMGNAHPLAQNVAKIAIRNGSLSANWRMPTIMDLMAAKIVQGKRLTASSSSPTDIPNNVNGIPDVPASPPGVPLSGRQELQQELDKMLAFELRHGQKMNPNRLWGNGKDDDGDGVVDEPDEEPGNGIWYDPARTPNTYTVDATLGYSNDYSWTTPNAWSQVTHPRSRGLFARHLFCLMMLMVDLDYTPTTSPPGQPQLEGFMEPFVDPEIPSGAGGAQARRELTIRRIAQWAVNVVDFRDADGIMTPFEYDVNPWNGWDVDGDITTNEGASTDRRVVWGCEQPDLLLTEALAFHDRRVKDTSSESDGSADGDSETSGQRRTDTPEPDSTLDQYRMPQGSLFLELYCPRRNVYWNPPAPATPTDVDPALAPPELYNVDATNGVRLDLARRAPAADPMQPNVRYPVWRLAITKSHRRGAEAGREGPLEMMAANKIDTPSFPPRTDDQLPVVGDPASSSIPPLPIEREVWFTPLDPEAAGFANHNRIYYNRYGPDTSNPTAAARDVEIGAGEYLVIGPRARTFIGSEDTDADPATPMSFDPNAKQEFQLVNGVTPAFAFVNAAGEPGYPTTSQIKRPKAIIAAANPPTTFTEPNLQADLLDGAGPLPNVAGTPLSVSEPLRDEYYPEPNAYLEGSSTLDHPIKDTWGDDDGMGGVTLKPKDEPFERSGSNADPDYPVAADGMTRTGVYADYKTVFLQRLANPMAPYHPEFNPYMTVDWHPIPLTVFNGEDSPPASAPGNWDPDDDNFDRSDAPDFESSERNGEGNFNIWKASFSSPNAHDGTRTANDFLAFNVRHSLGYLNRKIDNTPDHFSSDTDDFWVSPPAHPSVVGEPTQPFPWLVWNDRPYASHLELMMVPASSPSRLLTEWRIWGHGDTNGNPYLPYSLSTHPVATISNPPYSSYRAPFGHLLNFFNTSATPTMMAATPSNRGANFYRILDFLEVPSHFAGAEKWFNPTQFGSSVTSGFAAQTFRPPFNFLSRFRDPGRVNVNTMWDARVWRGVNEGYPGLATGGQWNNVNTSMQNPTSVQIGAPVYPSATGPTLPSPSAYSNAMRSVGSAAATPLALLEQPGVFATLLRRDPNSSLINPLRPLLDAPDSRYPSDSSQSEIERTRSVHPSRNAYFRYQGLQRLGNLVSTQSNVYAVWVTMGYFEVETNPGGVDLTHPDGYRLGPELGIDTGEVTRHRAFYLIDRSIPVAFQPGTNHNVEKAILLRRLIE